MRAPVQWTVETTCTFCRGTGLYHETGDAGLRVACFCVATERVVHAADGKVAPGPSGPAEDAGKDEAQRGFSAALARAESAEMERDQLRAVVEAIRRRTAAAKERARTVAKEHGDYHYSSTSVLHWSCPRHAKLPWRVARVDTHVTFVVDAHGHHVCDALHGDAQLIVEAVNAYAKGKVR